MREHSDLIIPVYLNQRVVFDLVAMLQGGIATVTKVAEVHREAVSGSADIGSSFGLNKALASLLKVDLSGELSGGLESGADRTKSEERVHTPASLFFTVRELLQKKGVLAIDSVNYKATPGDFLEFTSVLSRNPLIETMDAMAEMMEMAAIFSETVKKKGKGQSETTRVRKQIESFAGKLKTGDTLDLITPPLLCSHSSVVTLEAQYLNDPSLADLVEGTFRVIGKVIRIVEEGGGGISLVRKTALGHMPRSTLQQAFSGLESALSEFNFPKLSLEIEGPVIQVLPVAIFS